MELNERIKTLRLKNDMTQKELCEKLGVSTVSIRHWEAGTKKPSMLAVVSLAEIFRVSTDYLLGVKTNDNCSETLLLSKNEELLIYNYRSLDNYGKKAVDAICTIEKTRVKTERDKTGSNTDIILLQKGHSRFIPLYTTPSAAGLSVPLDNTEFEMISVNDSIPKDADFAVRIQGDSMLPYIHDNDIVYVKRNCKLLNGDIGIFCVNGAMYCKQYYIDKFGNVILISANPSLKHTNINIKINSDARVQCYGKVLVDFRTELPDYIYE